MQYYTGFTLVDITATGVTRGGDSHERGQQSNWETVLQCISLLAQPMDIRPPSIITNVDCNYLHFGDFYEGQHTVWAWSFGTEHSDVFHDGQTAIGGLEKCFEQVPVITGLDETARFMLPIFYPYGAIKNVYFKPGVKNINNI